jgi:hypothetical protein
MEGKGRKGGGSSFIGSGFLLKLFWSMALKI